MSGNAPTPLQAIAAYCLGCVNGEKSEVKLCPCRECELYKFREGRGNSRPMSEAAKAAASERMKKMRNRNIDIQK